MQIPKIAAVDSNNSKSFQMHKRTFDLLGDNRKSVYVKTIADYITITATATTISFSSVLLANMENLQELLRQFLKYEKLSCQTTNSVRESKSNC